MYSKKAFTGILTLALAAGLSFSLGAQTIDQAAIAQALAAQQGEGTAPTVAPAQPAVTALTTPAPGAATTPGVAVPAQGSSSIESMFADMASGLGTPAQALSQFGYSLFDKPSLPSLASIGDDYILGPGDSLVLYLWGDPVDIKELSASYSLPVDRNGFIFLQPAGQIAVWGQDLGTVRSLIKSMLDRRYKKLEMSLTLSGLRQFPVFVSGYAGTPGTVLATGADTVLTILSRAGGIKKTGSLRTITLTRQVRGSPETVKLDFYDNLIKGISVDLRVREGDSIFIPGIGPVAALSGELKRPGIYELKGATSVASALELAGGALPSARASGVTLLTFSASGKTLVSGDLASAGFAQRQAMDGDFLYFGKVTDLMLGQTQIAGPVKYPGRYELASLKTLKALLGNAQVLPETNLLYGRVYRMDVSGRDKSFAFSPRDVLSGADIALSEFDRVVLYRYDDVGLDPDFDRFPSTLVVSGPVKYPGFYLYKEGMTLSSLLADNALTLDASRVYAEIVSKSRDGRDTYASFSPEDVLSGKADVKLSPLDRVRFEIKGADIAAHDFNKFPDAVTLSGQVARPEVYALRSGMKLSQVLTSDQLLLDSNLNYAEILRQKADGKNEYFTFRPSDVLSKAWDFDLGPRDVIRLVKVGYAPATSDFDRFKDAVLLSGPAQFTGLYAWKPGIRLSSVLALAKPALDVNQVYAEIVRPSTDAKFEYLSFAPREIASGTQDIELAARDSIKLFARTAVPVPAPVPAPTATPTVVPVEAPAPAVATPAPQPQPQLALPPVIEVKVPAKALSDISTADLDHFRESVVVSGSVRYTGPYARTPGLKLSSIITGDQMLETTNLEYAELTRLKADGTPEFATFAPREVLEGRFDLALRARDSIRLVAKTTFGGTLTAADVEKFASLVQLTGQAARPEVFALRSGMKLSQIVTADQMLLDTNQNYAEITRLRSDGKNDYLTFRPADVLSKAWDFDLGSRDVIKLVKVGYAPEKPDFDRFAEATLVSGPARFPGLYSVYPGLSLFALVNSARLLEEANPDYAELSRVQADGRVEYQTFSPRDVLEKRTDLALRARDSVRFVARTAFRGTLAQADVEKFADLVQLTGQAARPEVFALRQGMKLSQILTKDQLLLDTNLNYAEILRQKADGKNEYITFRPRDLLDGSWDLELSPRDTVRLVKVGYSPARPEFDRYSDAVLLAGPVEFSGLYAWKPDMKLSSLLALARPALETNQVYAEIVRPLAGGRFEYLTFAPREVSAKKFDLNLKARDAVRLFTTAPVVTVKQGAESTAVPAAPVSAAPASTAAPVGSTDASAAPAVPAGDAPAAATPVMSADQSADLSRFLEVVTISGAVRSLSPYARTPTLTLASVITPDQILEETNLYYAELTRLREDGSAEYLTFQPRDVLEGRYDLALRARDSIRLVRKTVFGGALAAADPEKFASQVQLTGRVARPEVFALSKGLKLSQVLTREQILLDTNLNYGEITRLRSDGRNEYRTFRPAEVLAGSWDLDLGARDTIKLYKVGYAPEKPDFDHFIDVVQVLGPVQFGGLYAFRPGMKLSVLQGMALVILETNQVYADITRPLAGGKNQVLTFAPREVTSGQFDLELSARDVVRFYSIHATKAELKALGEVAPTVDTAGAAGAAPAAAATGTAAPAGVAAAVTAVAAAPAAAAMAAATGGVAAAGGAISTDTGFFLEVVSVSGVVRYIGPYARTPTLKLSSVVTADQVLQDTNLDYAELTRRKSDGGWEYTTFSPRDVLAGKVDLDLRAQDAIRFVKVGYLPEKPDFDHFANAYAVKGAANLPGLYSISKPSSLSEIIVSQQFLSNTDVHYAEIERWVTGGRTEYLTFSPLAVLMGTQNARIFPRDIIRLIPADESGLAHDFSRYPDTVLFQGTVRYPGRYAWYEGMKLADILSPDDFLVEMDTSYAEIRRQSADSQSVLSFSPARVVRGELDLELASRDVVIFYPRYYNKPVTITGEVTEPKVIPYFDSMELSAALRSVNLSGDFGSLKAVVTKADGTNLVVYLEDYFRRLASQRIILNPGDSVSIKKLLPDEHLPVITVRGAVKKPQSMEFSDGMRLSDALKAAGGFDSRAYPFGLVLIRKSAAESQQKQVDRLIAQLEAASVAGAAMPSSSDTSLSSAAAVITNLQIDLAVQKAKLGGLKQLYKEGFGRISLDVPSSLEALAASRSNVVLERDDLIFVPTTPTYVLVSGEVSDQNVVAFREGMTVKDAISESGWLSAEADLSNSYIIRASGRLDSTERKGFLFFKPNILNFALNPGDTVVVPPKSAKISVAWSYVRDGLTVISSILTGALTAKTLLGL
jgi:protein involved in polysaccharide export with SLBB domain